MELGVDADRYRQAYQRATAAGVGFLERGGLNKKPGLCV